MEELIRRSDAIDAIENTDWYHQNRNKDMVSGANSDEHQAWYKADDVYKALEAVPVTEPKRGEWIDNGDRYFRCSLCGTKDTDKWHWCHGCGAKMKGADDE